jgi:hypothetical protein
MKREKQNKTLPITVPGSLKMRRSQGLGHPFI